MKLERLYSMLKVKVIFHRLWTMAVPPVGDYDIALWMELQRRIEGLEKARQDYFDGRDGLLGQVTEVQMREKLLDALVVFSGRS